MKTREDVIERYVSSPGIRSFAVLAAPALTPAPITPGTCEATEEVLPPQYSPANSTDAPSGIGTRAADELAVPAAADALTRSPKPSGAGWLSASTSARPVPLFARPALPAGVVTGSSEPAVCAAVQSTLAVHVWLALPRMMIAPPVLAVKTRWNGTFTASAGGGASGTRPIATRAPTAHSATNLLRRNRYTTDTRE